jgi:peptidoglycan-associated lipoprotein
MKLAPKKFCVVVAAAALVLAGCTQKPMRPDPSVTALGMTPGGGRSGGLNPTDMGPVNLEAPGLTQRPEGFDINNQNRTALQPVYFEFNQSDIKQAERSKLQAAKEYLSKNPTYRLLLEGHCDWRGTAEYNLALGERRANAVKAYLASIGVGADKLESLSKGSLEAARNADDSTMAKDRRVDVVVLAPGMGPAPL